MKKLKKKWIVLLCLAAAASVCVGAVFLNGSQHSAMPVSTVSLARTELQNTVAATGTVSSAQAANVYTSLGSNIQSIHVQVGDRVEAGDILCELDTQRLQLDIAMKTAELNKAAASAQHELSVSQRKYEEAQQNLKNNLNAEIVSSEGAMRSAQKALENAREAFEEAKTKYDKEDDEDTKYTIGSCDHPVTLHELRDAKEAALRTYNEARIAYKNAVDQLDVAMNSADQSLSSYEDSIEQSKIAADLSADQLALQKLRMDLADSTLVSPIAGTVTAVYAKEGAPGNGLMFVVENTDSLIVKTSLREYDIASVTEGMPVTIKSDATGEDVFEGEVSRIYPTAKKGDDGTTKSDGNVEFETDIALTSPESGLRIGMNVRLNIITAQKENVWAVPYDAVFTNKDGQSAVYVARPNPEGNLTAVSIPVSTGLETDFYIEVSSDGLQDGDQVISDPSNIQEGAAVTSLSGSGNVGQAMAVSALSSEVPESESCSSSSSEAADVSSSQDDAATPASQEEGA